VAGTVFHSQPLSNLIFTITHSESIAIPTLDSKKMRTGKVGDLSLRDKANEGEMACKQLSAESQPQAVPATTHTVRRGSKGRKSPRDNL
jgi:hypothetical protein